VTPHRHDPGGLANVARLDVSYEMKMMAAMSRPMIPSDGSGDLVACTAMFEACLIHARNLHEFLGDEQRGGWQRRVLAKDYFDDALAFRPKKVLTAAEGYAISRKVAHLFCDRRSSEYNCEVTGDSTAVAGRLLDGMAAFIEALQAVHPDRAAWFAPGLIEARRELQVATSAGHVVSRVWPAPQGAIPFWVGGSQTPG
jgi:hypothetical protein